MARGTRGLPASKTFLLLVSVGTTHLRIGLLLLQTTRVVHLQCAAIRRETTSPSAGQKIYRRRCDPDTPALASPAPDLDDAVSP